MQRLLTENQCAAGFDPIFKPGGGFRVNRVDAGGNQNPVAPQTAFGQLLFKNHVNGNLRIFQRFAIGDQEVAAQLSGGASQTVRRLGIEHGDLAFHAAIARGEKIRYRHNVFFRIHQSEQRFGRNSERVEHHIGKRFGELFPAFRLRRPPLWSVAPATPFENIRGVEPPGELKDDFIAETLPGFAHVSFAVGNRFPVGDGPEKMRLHKIAAAGRAAHHVHMAIHGVHVDVGVAPEKRLHAESGFGTEIDFPHFLNSGGTDVGKSVFHEFDPFDAERRVFGLPFEVADGGKVGIFGPPCPVERGEIVVVLLFHPFYEEFAVEIAPVVVIRLVEKFVDEGLDTEFLEVTDSIGPHFQPELSPFGSCQAVRDPVVVVGSGNRKRLFRREFSLLVFQRAVVPAGAGVIHVNRKPGLQKPPVHCVIVTKTDIVLFRTVFVDPPVGCAGTDRIEADPLKVLIILRAFIKPFQFGGVAVGRNTHLLRDSLIIEDPFQITRFAVSQQMPIRRNGDFRVGFHQYRRGEFLEFREWIKRRSHHIHDKKSQDTRDGT
ncbi:MAG: hypothetical protein BWY31_04300 [Lentisphaerae bacterium ADurb.Bin242]|nr:MAG: hypothetical protein BWY31_04300 [Lentisphaerae bacterium ADurb.Bin242]